MARRYNLEQEQRKCERNIRKYDRLSAGTLDNDLASKYRDKSRQWTAQYNKLIKDNPDVLRKQPERLKLYGIAQIEPKPKKVAVKATQKATKVSQGKNIADISTASKKFYNDIDKCTKVEDINNMATDYFKNKTGCNIENVHFTRTTDIDAVKDMVKKVDDLDNRFDSTLGELTSKALSAGTGGECTPNIGVNEYLRTSDMNKLRSTITINSSDYKTRVVTESIYNNNIKRAAYGTGVCHNVVVPTSLMNLDTVTHEYGHSILGGKINEILISNGGENDTYTTARRIYRQYMNDIRSLDREINAIRNKFAGMENGLQLGLDAVEEAGLNEKMRDLCISQYSKSSCGEFIAESFCDAELNGENAKAYSKKIYKLLVKEFGKG